MSVSADEFNHVAEVLGIDIYEEPEQQDYINSLIESAKEYIESATGKVFDKTQRSMICMTLLVKLWYFSDHTDTDKLNRITDSLLKSIALSTT